MPNLPIVIPAIGSDRSRGVGLGHGDAIIVAVSYMTSGVSSRGHTETKTSPIGWDTSNKQKRLFGGVSLTIPSFLL